MRTPQLDRCDDALVGERRGHPDVDNRNVRTVMVNGDAECIGVGHCRDHLVPPLGE
jgi:hypothetical protein